jgi:hypothetical protein
MQLETNDPPQFTDASPAQDSDRRRSPRRTVTGRVTTLSRGLGGQPEQKRISSLQLRDMSDAGVGALADQPLDVGGRVALFFPPHGNAPGFDLYGTVVRCHREGACHSVGIQLDQSIAA